MMLFSIPLVLKYSKKRFRTKMKQPVLKCKKEPKGDLMSQQSGFTVLEVIIVGVSIGILTLLAYFVWA